MILSLRGLAREVGVSAATVSKVLGNRQDEARISTRRREQILEVARISRYRPNDDIAILLPENALENAHQMRVLRGFHLATQDRNLRLVSETLSLEQVPLSIEHWRVGAAILISQVPASTLEALNLRGIPYVLFNPDEESKEDCLICDDYLGITQASQYLLEQGCEEIIFLLPGQDHVCHQKRLRAYRDFCQQNDLREQVFTETTFHAAAEKITPFATHKKNLGVLTLSDWELALRVLITAHAPKTAKPLHIVAVNEPASPWLKPEAVLRVPLKEMARRSVEMILEKWQSGVAHLPSITISPTLQIEKQAASQSACDSKSPAKKMKKHPGNLQINQEGE